VEGHTALHVVEEVEMHDEVSVSIGVAACNAVEVQKRLGQATEAVF
jgi:hypothetical protein